MDFLILATIVVLASGTSTPLPQNPGIYLQVQPPIKPTKSTGPGESSISMEEFGPQAPSKEPATAPTKDKTEQDTATVVKNVSEISAQKAESVDTNVQTNDQTADTIKPPLITAKFAAMNVESANQVTEIMKKNTASKADKNTQTNGKSIAGKAQGDQLQQADSIKPTDPQLQNAKAFIGKSGFSDVNTKDKLETLNNNLADNSIIVKTVNNQQPNSKTNDKLLIDEGVLVNPNSGANVEVDKTSNNHISFQSDAVEKTPAGTDTSKVIKDNTVIPVANEGIDVVENVISGVESSVKVTNAGGTRSTPISTVYSMKSKPSSGAIILDKENNPVIEPSGAIKNKDNVPTADELLKSGNFDTNEISKMQVRVDGSKKPVDDLKPTWIKNRDNVPTRRELIESGNIDPSVIPILQVRLEDTPWNLNEINLQPEGMSNTDNWSNTNERIDAKPKLSNLAPDKLRKVETVETPALKKVEDSPLKLDLKPTGIKNRDNVPTAEELLKSGNINPNEIPMMQVRVDGPLPNEGLLVPVPSQNTVSSTSKTSQSASNSSSSDAGKSGNKMAVSGEVVLSQTLGEKDSASMVVETPLSQSTATRQVTEELKPVLAQHTPNSEKLEIQSAAIVNGMAIKTGSNEIQIPNTASVTSVTNVTETSNDKTDNTTAVQGSESTTTGRKAIATDNTTAVQGSESTTTGSKAIATTETSNTQMSVEKLVTEKVTYAPVELTTACPTVDCTATSCPHGRKVDNRGCQTCTCKFSDACPPVLPVSRLLCLLQVRSSLSCDTDADCKANRICCPGTCGSMCRRRSNRRRAMLLSILDGAL